MARWPTLLLNLVPLFGSAARSARPIGFLELSNADGTSEEAHGNLQMAQIRSAIARQSLSSFLSEGRSGSDSIAPELQKWFADIDAKMRPTRWRCTAADGQLCGLSDAGTDAAVRFDAGDAWKSGDCMSMARQIPERRGSKEFRTVHTGFFVKPGTPWKMLQRKFRLGALSFLSTQDLEHTKLMFWSDAYTMSLPAFRKAFKPILEHPDLSHSLELAEFNALLEMSKLSTRSSSALIRLYSAAGDMMASQSDILRAVVLHNYGGLWMDADVLMIRDFAPLMGDDWAYLGQKGFINNALISVSRPGSPFILAYLAAIVARGGLMGNHAQEYFAYGPELLPELYERIGSNGTFHVLPTCFFDGYWSREQDTVSWDEFNGRAATEAEVTYVFPGSFDAFAYHWHGRWELPILHGSLADSVEQRYLSRLGLDGVDDGEA